MRNLHFRSVGYRLIRVLVWILHTVVSVSVAAYTAIVLTTSVYQHLTEQILIQSHVPAHAPWMLFTQYWLLPSILLGCMFALIWAYTMFTIYIRTRWWVHRVLDHLLPLKEQ